MEEFDAGKKDVLVIGFGKDLFNPKFDGNINTWETYVTDLVFQKKIFLLIILLALKHAVRMSIKHVPRALYQLLIFDEFASYHRN